MPILPPSLDLDEPPTKEELVTALTKMKMRKVGGKTGILPEMVLLGGEVLLGQGVGVDTGRASRMKGR